MNNIKHIIYTLGLVATITVIPATAQNVTSGLLPDAALPAIVTPHAQTVGYAERTLCINVEATVPYEVTSSADWATVRTGSDGTIYIHLTTNYDGEARVANIVFANAEQGVSSTFAITQDADGSAADIPTDTRVYPSSATANNYQGGYDITKTYDDDYSTLYHSAYSGNTVSESNPAILTYNFSTSTTRIDYVTYVPRQDASTSGGANGNFGKVNVYVKTRDGQEVLYGTYDWNYGGSKQTISFGDEGLVNPQYVRFEVLSGYNGYASCAEMEFYTIAEDNGTADYAIFADDLYTKLRDNVTEDDLDALANPFVKSLATKIYNGTYSTDYRVATFPCLLSVNTLSDLWNAPGKLYDQTQGVTGISVGSGTHAVVVRGLADGETATLKLVSWYNGKVGGNFDGGNPQETDYTLSNGINVIKYYPEKALSYEGTYSSDYDALAYIDYNADTLPDTHPDISIHFVNGVVNGYLSPDKTNAEMHELTANAKNYCMDVVGHKAHSVWTSAGLHNYCKDTNNNQKGYRQYINVLDSLVQWEHDLLGFTKYNMLPTNKTFAYVNFTYYMFQGGRGVSFHADQESRVLNCRTLVYNDDDAIWGLSHEWGHQHQMQPYFCWAGMSEVTNNMNSFYNIMHMGYQYSDKINNFKGAINHFVNKDYSDVTRGSNMRSLAYQHASDLSFCTEMKNLALAMKDSTITDVSADSTKALSINEVGVGETLAPFILLYSYFYNNGFPEFAQDWYEALRENDNENGSVIEKQNGVDKYELIASSQNNNKNGKYAVLKAQYPNSCWVKQGYVSSSSTRWQNSAPYVLNFIRKTSRLSGYNLVPFFEQWGFLRHVALYIGDYGNKWFVLTDKMYEEFIDDMNALNLKPVTPEILQEIANLVVIESSGKARIPSMERTRPTFPN